MMSQGFRVVGRCAGLVWLGAALLVAQETTGPATGDVLVLDTVVVGGTRVQEAATGEQPIRGEALRTLPRG